MVETTLTRVEPLSLQMRRDNTQCRRRVETGSSLTVALPFTNSFRQLYCLRCVVAVRITTPTLFYAQSTVHVYGV